MDVRDKQSSNAETVRKNSNAFYIFVRGQFSEFANDALYSATWLTHETVKFMCQRTLLLIEMKMQF